ncbi:MAG: hypothetical protein ACN4GW_16265 [Desulforhopalus sp.]
MNSVTIHPLSQVPAANSYPPANPRQEELFDDLLTGYIKQRKPQNSTTQSTQPGLLIGEITHETPTVSELLMQHKELRSSTWDIIHSEQNRNKDYTKIQPGTRIYYNSEEGALSWKSPENISLKPPNSAVIIPIPPPVSPTPENSGRPATNLSEAVQRYMGTSYDKINCYELLVKGLRQMDIPYSGKDGLYSKLTRMAIDKGKAPNAYLNGEGIVKAAGSLVMSSNYPEITNWRDEAAALIKEIEPLLDNGQILSFSTERRGHTGVVSQQDNQWTFINSGRLDNPVESNSVRRGVGEEILREEIRNWFKLAHTKKETLSVTLGQLEQGKIRTAFNMPRTSSKRS